MSDHELVKSPIAFPHQVAHIPNKVSLLSLPLNAAVDPYEQGLGNVFERHTPQVFKLPKKDSADWLSDSY